MSMQKTVASIAVGLALTTTYSFAETFTTGFERLNETSGIFTLNESPNSVTFEGGEAKVIGVGSLYLDGVSAFLFMEGTPLITFETPPESVTLNIRNRVSTSVTTANIFEVGNNDPVATINGTNSQWRELTFTSEVGIERIELSNNSDDYAAIDVFSFTPFDAEPPTPDPEPTPAPTQLEDPIAESIQVSDISVELELINESLSDPLLAITAPGVENFTFIAEQSGNILSINEANDEFTNILSVADTIVTESERGLIGLAFHPDFATNGLLYTHTSEPATEQIDFNSLTGDDSVNHMSVVSEWQATTSDTQGLTIDGASRRVLFTIAQPQDNHNGGALVFDQQNNLIIGVGDGGAADDQGVGHSEGGNGQDKTNVLGTLMRIDPLTRNAENGNYGIPADNPYVSDDSIPNEIYATGLRNPFKVFFDSNSNQLIVADVGQNDIEEVNIVEAGDNLGWPLREGSFGFFNNGDLEGYVFDQQATADLKDPLAQYDHDSGIAIIGGLVYKGNVDDTLQGQYVFADVLARLFYLDDQDQINQVQLPDGLLAGQAIIGLGEDTRGQLYVLTREFSNPVGRVYRVNNLEEVAPPAPPAPVPPPAPAPPPTPTPPPVAEEPATNSSGGGLGFLLIIGMIGLVKRLIRKNQ